MADQTSQKVTILCDFDGTITPIDVADFLYQRCAACGLYYSNLGAQGLVSTREEILQTFATASAGREEIAAALTEVPIDLTFHQLVDFADKNGIELAVASDGLDWAIETVLAGYGIHGLPIYANHVAFEGGQLSFEFPWFDPSSPMDGVCKICIIQRYHQEGTHVVYIGNGRSDFVPVTEADLVFAKDELEQFCNEQGIPYINYSRFDEICPQLAAWLISLNNQISTQFTQQP